MSTSGGLSVAALGRRARRSSLGVKLGALGAVITAAVLAVAFWVLSIEIRTSTRQQVTSQLARDQRSAQQLQAREASELLFAVSLITQTPTFQYDLNIYRAEKNATGKARVDLVNTVEEAATLVRAIDHPNLRTMIDCSAAGATEAVPVADLIDRWLPSGLVAHIQVNDPNRRAPGQGEMRFAPILAALERNRYQGVVSVEPFDYVPDGIGSAAFAIAYLRGLREGAGRQA